MSGKEKKTSTNDIRVCKVFIELFGSTRYVSATKLRGFFGTLFVDEPEFHHHSVQAYHYPLVQYKKIDGRLMVMGFQNFANLLINKLSSIDMIRIQGIDYPICNKLIVVETFLVENINCVYDFVSPWLPLNEANYVTFQKLPFEKQRLFLENILVGNVLSCLKGLGIFVNFRICSQLLNYRALPVRAHGNSFQGFKAQFCLNVSLPDFLGLGKSVSKGFGIIKRKV